jgi:hypothetical protein
VNTLEGLTQVPGKGNVNMAGIPTNVQEAADKAEKFVTTGDVSTEPTPTATEPTPAPETPPSQPEQTPAQPAPSPELNTHGKAGAQPTAEPPQPANEVESLKAENARLSQNLIVLQGKFDAEVPRYARDLRELRDENRQLREQAIKAEAAPPAPPPVNVQDLSKEDMEKLFSEETRDMLEDDVLREILAATQAGLVTPQLQAQQEELQKLRAEMAQGTEQAFHRQIYDKIPDMVVLNSDEGFNTWLDTRITEFAPLTYRDAFDRAYNTQDVNGLAEIVKQYTPAPVSTLASNQTLPVTPTVASQIVPVAEGTVVSPAPVEGKTYSPQEFSRLSNKLNVGGLDAESRKRLKQELDEAIVNGLVK